MNLFLIVLFLISFFSLARKKLEWAVMLIIAGLPLYLWRFSVLSIPFTVLEAMILIVFVVWFFTRTNFKNFIKGSYSIKDYLSNKKKRLSYPFAVEASAVIVFSFIAMSVAGFSSSSLGIWKAYFFEPLLLFIIILNVFQGRDAFRKIILSLSVGAFIVSLYAIIQKITGVGIANEFWRVVETRRVVSFFGYPNAVGLYLSPIILIITGYIYRNFFSKRKKENIFLFATIIVSFLAIYFAKSEGALVAVLFSLMVFAFLVNKISRIAVLLAVVLFVGIFITNGEVRDYAIKKASLMDLSGQIRRQQWTETWEMLKEGRLFSGSGLANYQEAISSYHQEGIFVDNGDPDFRRKIVIFDDKYKAEHWQPVEIYMYPHNFILNFWTELGVLGMLVFVWMFIRTIFILVNNFRVRTIKHVKDAHCPYVSLGIACALLTMIIHGMVDVPYFKNDLSLMFWIIMAMTGLIILKNHKIKSRNKVAIKK